MKISARNQLRGKVETIVLGVVTAKVAVRVGENLIESVITRQSVEDLGIKIGDEVTAIIKSTEIMLMEMVGSATQAHLSQYLTSESLTTRNRRDNEERLGLVRDCVGQRGIRWFMGRSSVQAKNLRNCCAGG